MGVRSRQGRLMVWKWVSCSFPVHTAGPKGVTEPQGVRLTGPGVPSTHPSPGTWAPGNRGLPLSPAPYGVNQTEPWPLGPPTGHGGLEGAPQGRVPVRPSRLSRLQLGREGGSKSGQPGLARPGPGASSPLGSSWAGVERGRPRPHRHTRPRRPLAPSSGRPARPPCTRPRLRPPRPALGCEDPAQVRASGPPR